VLITSARPNEGKTFTSLNLAASIAAGGRSPVVLVDADGKRGSLSTLLGLPDAPGLRLMAADPKLRGANLLVPTAQERLSILPFGAQSPGEAELPPGEMLAAAILRTALALPEHIIVIDSPPCLSTSDPSSLAPIAGQVLLVIQAERTQQSEVEAALDLVDSCPTLQLMLNRTKLTTSNTFGAYGEYDVYGAYGSRPSS
jgi:receptor protein-tyrosine kinase